MTSYEPSALLFASDADLLALLGVSLLLMAATAWIMDRRRHNRDRISAADRVGWMPWTMIFLLSAVIGIGLLAVSVPALIAG